MGAIEQQAVFSKAGWIADNIKEGEAYAGIILGKNGERDYHLIFLPEGDKATWKGAMNSEAISGGKGKQPTAFVPNRRELRLGWVNCAESFKTDDWYWSSEQYAGDGDYAWAQHFRYGDQSSIHENYECRVRLVRRVFI